MQKIVTNCSKILFFFIISSSLVMKPNIAENPVQETWVNIFIHGIIKTPWSLKDLFKIGRNSVTGTDYAYAAEYVRNCPQYFVTQPMQHIGLQPINLDTYSTNASYAIATIFDLDLQHTNNFYYTFGWSGLLSKFHRQEEAMNLFKSLKQLLSSFKKQNISPKVRIIAYSHGGNVILNMPKLIPCDDLPFIIDELILLGVPIQRETDYLINHPIYKKIYNFYSLGDLPQVADFLTTKYGRSERKFKKRKNFEIPEKLTQVRVSTTKTVYTKDGRILRIYISDPQHTEMWSFGWCKKGYRCNFSLNPLPVVSLTPYIIQTIESLKNDLSNHVSININPDNQIMDIKDICTNESFTICLNNKIDNLRNLATELKPVIPKNSKLMKKALTYAYDQQKINNKCHKNKC